MKKIWNINTWIAGFKDIYNRFSSVIVYLILIFVVACTANHDIINNREYIAKAIFYLVTGTLLNLNLQLWYERTRKSIPVIGVGALLHLTLGVYSYMVISTDDTNIIVFTSILSIYVAILLAFFTQSFRRSTNDMRLWTFMLQTILGITIAFFSALLLTGATQILFVGIEMLFDITIDFKLRADTIFFFMALVGPYIFLLFIPSLQKIQNPDINTLPPLVHKLIRYVLLFIFFIYALTIYLYTAKILYVWELPNGWVSWLVSILMLGVVLLTVLLYPSVIHSQNKFDHKLLRFLPFIMLPPLALMTVGIIRRLSDYGISIPRLYLLTFNLWCYIACFYLIIKQSSRFKFLLVSFGLLFIITSIGPWSFANVVYRSYTQDLRTSIEQKHTYRLPIDSSQVVSWYRSLPHQERTEMCSKVESIQSFYQVDSLQTIFADIKLYEVNNIMYQINQEEDTTSVSVTHKWEYQMPTDKAFNLPKGYNKVWYVSQSYITDNEWKIPYIIKITRNNHTYQFVVTKTLLEQWKKSEQKENFISLQTHQAQLVFTDIEVHWNDNTLTINSYSAMLLTP